MKKISILALSLILSLSLLAYPPQAKLTISSHLKNAVAIVVDGKNYTANNSHDDMMINNLQAGHHTIKIYQQNGRSRQLVYNGKLNVKPQYHVNITINRFGKTFIDERKMTAEDDDNDNNYGSWDINNRQEMSAGAFTQFKKSISNVSFDNSKQNIAKQTIAANYLSAAQVKEIVQLFSFESSKLEIAKFSYAYTLDKGNYFLVNDALTYSTSKDELAKYLLQQK
jgi:uncharacterized protein YxeA